MPSPWQVLSEAMKATGKFNPRGLEKEQLMRDYLFGRAVAVWKESRIITYGALERTLDPEVLQLRKIYVAGEHRGNGHCLQIVKRLLAIPRNKSVTYFAFTDDQSLMRALTECGLRPVTKAVMPNVEEWAVRVGCRDRLPESALRLDPPNPKAGERWLFMRG